MGLRMSGEERRLEQIDGSATQVRGAAAVLEACQASHSPLTMTDAHDCLPRTNRPIVQTRWVCASPTCRGLPAVEGVRPLSPNYGMGATTREACTDLPESTLPWSTRKGGTGQR